ncbi:OmpH family outer membrane protein [Psychroserpens algicola]|uniref:OmpH family outer membrane protein n=1 Tax=Psychroserpens algicola TaxID=1719034 RepID=A0ABT0HBL0_9FLAO|nr:OmpH family outer membrane protein [Psychroserpens algicola]MCK8481761.1 OmpH family outer membrane protein [Psychroserpens algicola]
MKNILSVLSLVLLLASCQEQQKIAFVDNGEIINAYQEKIDVEAKYKLKDEDFKKRTDSIGQAFQLEVQSFQVNASKLSQKKQQEQGQALGQKQQLLQQQLQREQQVLTDAFNVEIDSVISHVKTFVADYGKKNGYSFILGKNEAGSVMYGQEQNDITGKVIEAINAKYKAKE